MKRAILLALLATSAAFADQEVINVGAAPNDGTGDPARDAFIKVNDNFTELYDFGGSYTGVLGGNFFLGSSAWQPGNYSLPATNTLNTGFGVGVFDSLTSVSGQNGNTAFGYYALHAGTTISGETAFGKWALRDDVEGNFNTAIGQTAMRCFTGTGTKSGNVAVGHGALGGDDTLCANIPGGYPGTYGGNTAVGAWSGQELTTGNSNVLLGDSAGVDLTTGATNVGIGFYALCAPTVLETIGQACAGVQQSIGIGYHALRYNQANANIGIGYEALGTNTTGAQNVALGFQALANTTTDLANTALGYDSFANQTGSAGFNTGVGANTGKLITTGTQNTYLGANAGAVQTTTNNNTGIGQAALTNATGGTNTALGSHAGTSITSGNLNIIIGSSVASTTCTTCAGNILIGLDSTTDTVASSTTHTLQIRGQTPGSPTIAATKINTLSPLLALPAIVNTGTTFTTTGCSVSAVAGGASAGTFTLGANTCTVIVTIAGAVGNAATTGWTCQAHDRTAPTVLIGGESSSTATTASIIIPAGAGATDVISFSCTGY